MALLKDYFQTYGIPSAIDGTVGIEFSSNLASRLMYDGMTPLILPAYSALYVKEGTIMLGVNKKQVTMSAGDFIFFSPRMLVTIESVTDNLSVDCLYCDKSIFDRLLIENGGDVAMLQIRQSFPVVSLDDVQQADFRQYSNLFLSTILSDHYYKEQLVMSQMRTFQLFLIDILHGHVDTTSFSSQHETIFRDFMQLATDNYQRQHKVQFYSDRLCISTTYLSRIVQGVIGKSAKEVLMEMLYNEACYQLRNKSVPMAEVSYDLGFEDQSAFNHFFRKRSGMTPNEYRMQKEL